MSYQMNRSLFWMIAVSLVYCCGCEKPMPPTPPASTTEVEANDETVAETTAAVVEGEAPADAEPSKDAEEMPAEEEAADEPESATDETSEEAASTAKVLLGSGELTGGIPGSGPLKLEEIKTWLADPKNHEVLEVELPLGLSAGQGQIKIPADNPLTRAKIELGRQLYFDRRLSKDGTISCADCHHPDEGYARSTRFGVGVGGQEGGRNSPTSYNRILSDAQFWDGRAGSLEEQAVGPIANAIEMASTHDACVECIKGIDGYRVQFEEIFGDVNIDNVGKAIASFERTIVTNPSPFDYYERFYPMKDLDPDDLKEDDPESYAIYEQAKAEMEANPMSESAKRGRDIFFGTKGGCTACHVGPNLTDEKYHNIGVGMDAENPDIGRMEVTKDEKDRGAFKTPTIRNVALTAPYMHDGSQKTLMEVVEWYAKGGHPNPNLSKDIKKLDLTEQDKADLVAFMEACTGEFPEMERERLPE